jgi:hypothetical protein
MSDSGYARHYTDKYGKEHLDIYNTDGHPTENDNHSSFHSTKNSDGTYNMKFTNSETGETTEVNGCYLTTACLKHFRNDFDDNCLELNQLRWFRDNFVSQEDIEHYYKISPIIVEAIGKEDNQDEIYNSIWQIVDACLKFIVIGRNEETYQLYKSMVEDLEERYAKSYCQKKLIKVLNNLKLQKN